MTTSYSPKKVLIVDDEPNVALMLAEGLEKLGEGYRFDTALGSHEALNKLQKERYDMLLVDYKMPGMNGIDLALAVRQQHPETQIVMMTAYGASGMRDALQHIKLDGFVEKPFTVEQIRQIVVRSIGKVSPRNAVPYTLQPATHPDVMAQLKGLQRDVGAQIVLLITSSGYPIEVIGRSIGPEITNISALVAAHFIAATELARLLGNTSIFKSSYHEGNDFNIYSYEVNTDFLLAVVFSPEIKPGAVWFYTKQTAAALKPLLSDKALATEFGSAPLREDTGTLIENLDDEFNQMWNDSGEQARDLMTYEQAIAAGLIPVQLARKRGPTEK